MHKMSSEDWVTLKEAAQMLNCSVKTVRRRVTEGKLHSTVEYQGNRAIRLVSRRDVLAEAPPIEALLPPGQFSEDLAAFRQHAPERLETALQTVLVEFKARSERATRRTRIYLLAGFGLGLLALAGAVFFVLDTQSGILRGEIEHTRGSLAAQLRASEAADRLQAREAGKNAQVSRVLGEASLQELEASRREVSTLRAEVAGLEEALARIVTALAASDRLRDRQLERLENLLSSRLPPEAEESDFEVSGDEETPAADSAPSP